MTQPLTLTFPIKKMNSLLILVLAAIANANPFCKDPPSVPIDIKLYSGQWYEIASTWTIYWTFERKCTCTEAFYEPFYDDSSFDPAGLSITNKCVIAGSGEVNERRGTLYPVSNTVTERPGDFTVQFDPRTPGKMGPKGSYIVVKVFGDYEHVLVSGRCSLYVWILSRSPNMDDATYAEIKDYAKSVGLHTKVLRLKRTEQQNCPERIQLTRPEWDDSE